MSGRTAKAAPHPREWLEQHRERLMVGAISWQAEVMAMTSAGYRMRDGRVPTPGAVATLWSRMRDGEEPAAPDSKQSGDEGVPEFLRRMDYPAVRPGERTTVEFGPSLFPTGSTAVPFSSSQPVGKPEWVPPLSSLSPPAAPATCALPTAVIHAAIRTSMVQESWRRTVIACLIGVAAGVVIAGPAGFWAGLVWPLWQCSAG